jgi:hypothetical protein
MKPTWGSPFERERKSVSLSLAAKTLPAMTQP